MDEEKIIDLISNEYDSSEAWQVAETISDVYEVFLAAEKILSDAGATLEHDVDQEHFEEVEAVEEDEIRNEVSFLLPIADTDLQLEFTYWREDDGYHMWVDVDFYSEEEDDEYYD